MKKSPIIFPLFGYEDLAFKIHEPLGYELGSITVHHFPDEETVIRFNTPIEGRELIFIGSLDHPNPKMAILLFAAETARSLGAEQIGFIAPYLSYMRQDKQFHPGEGVTSTYFARFLSAHIDWMMTIDPHLHRWHSLDELYTIPTYLLQASTCISAWIKAQCQNPLLIGPDAESQQWVAALAKTIEAPYLILNKERRGDTEVYISAPDTNAYREHTPILVDDIISSGATLIETIKQLKVLHMNAPICIGIHAIFAGNAYEALLHAGAKNIISCNTINHASNGIDISPVLINALRKR